MSVLRARVVGLVSVGALATAAQLPNEELDAAAIAARFDFASTTLDHRFGAALRQTRDVHASLRHIEPWIASVGAAAAMGDIDGNLKPDDTCYVDTRSNLVVAAPLLGERYASFTLIAPLTTEPAASVAPMGCLIADLNEDGLPDLLVYYWGRPPVAFLRIDQGPLTLETPPSAASFAPVALGGNERWFSNAALLADIDGDGHLDLVVGNYFCDGGRILDANTTAPVCPHPVMQDSMSRAFNGGVNRVLLWSSAAGGAKPWVRFKEVQGVFDQDVAQGWTLAIAARDLDGDGLPDLYFANDFGPDRLLINCARALESFGATRKQLGCFPLEGPVSFRTLEGHRSWLKPRSKVLGQDSFKGMGVEIADIDGDGKPDIFVSNITEKWALQESQFAFINDGRRIDAGMLMRGLAPFSDESEKLGLSRSGWAWDAKLADFDNDGQLEALQALGFVRGRNADAGLVWRKSCWAMLQELATANDGLLKHHASWFNMEQGSGQPGCDLSGHSRRNAFFVRQPTGRFADAAPLLKHLVHAAPAPTRGLAIGDADQDGRLDYMEARQFAAPVFHHNQSPAAAPGVGANTFLGLSPRWLVDGGSPRVSSVSEAAHLRSRPAVGALVSIRLSDGRRFSAEVDGGNGHSGKRSPDIHFGLGAVAPGTTADVFVNWRGGDGTPRSASFVALPVGQHLALLLKP